MKKSARKISRPMFELDVVYLVGYFHTLKLINIITSPLSVFKEVYY